MFQAMLRRKSRGLLDQAGQQLNAHSRPAVGEVGIEHEPAKGAPPDLPPPWYHHGTAWYRISSSTQQQQGRNK